MTEDQKIKCKESGEIEIEMYVYTDAKKREEPKREEAPRRRGAGKMPSSSNRKEIRKREKEKVGSTQHTCTHART